VLQNSRLDGSRSVIPLVEKAAHDGRRGDGQGDQLLPRHLCVTTVDGKAAPSGNATCTSKQIPAKLVRKNGAPALVPAGTMGDRSDVSKMIEPRC
jgi:hypothetical protein